jgi:hypothetical protein
MKWIHSPFFILGGISFLSMASSSCSCATVDKGGCKTYVCADYKFTGCQEKRFGCDKINGCSNY